MLNIPCAEFGRKQVAFPVEVEFSDVLSKKYIDSLGGVGPGTLDECFEELLEAADRVVAGKGLQCGSEASKTYNFFEDVRARGVGAVVDVSAIDAEVAGVRLSEIGRRLSVREAMIVYSALATTGVGCGARMEMTAAGTVKLVTDHAIDPMATVSDLSAHWARLGKTDEVKVSCSCLDAYPDESVFDLQWLLTCGDLHVARYSGYLFEVDRRGKVRMHDALCSRFGKPSDNRSLVVTFEALLASVDVSFRRWLHDRHSLCCGLVDNWECEVHRVLGYGWLVAGVFICDGGSVTTMSDRMMLVFTEMGLVGRDRSLGTWFDLDADKLSEYCDKAKLYRLLERMESESPGAGTFVKIDGLLTVIRALHAWVLFRETGSLALADVVLACQTVDDPTGAMVRAREVVNCVRVHSRDLI